MTGADPLPPAVLKRKAVVYVRQSTPAQVETNPESRRRQYELVDVARRRGFREVEVIDHRGARISGTDALTPIPVPAHAMRTDSGRPSSGIRFRTWTPMTASVAWRRSARERSASPITRL